MSNELQITPKAETTELTELTQAGAYLPQLRVYGSEASIVKEGKFPMGHFGAYFSADNVVDLGEQFDCLLIDWRYRASIMINDEQPVNYYNETTENFITVKDKALAKVEGHMAGLEYFLWVPSIKKFVLFFMGNPTLRRESGNVRALIGQAATLKIKLIKTKKYTWHGCEIIKCDSPLDMPEQEEAKKVHEKDFLNPKDSEVGVMSSDSEADKRAR